MLPSLVLSFSLPFFLAFFLAFYLPESLWVLSDSRNNTRRQRFAQSINLSRFRAPAGSSAEKVPLAVPCSCGGGDAHAAHEPAQALAVPVGPFHTPFVGYYTF